MKSLTKSRRAATFYRKNIKPIKGTVMEENIAALSTAFATAGVAVIRISGDSPLEIAEKMFAPQGKTPVKDFEPYKMYTGTIDGKTFTDYGMCVYFKAPKSYTGENMVEFHCHGGVCFYRGDFVHIRKVRKQKAT